MLIKAVGATITGQDYRPLLPASTDVLCKSSVPHILGKPFTLIIGTTCGFGYENVHIPTAIETLQTDGKLKQFKLQSNTDIKRS